VLLATAIIGAAAAALVFRLADDGTAQPWRLVRCCAGFVCSMVWIATIADEVVAVLQTFGEMFGLSDAIIGLTSELLFIGHSSPQSSPWATVSPTSWPT
jgi:sodium/potassium/calcium exchanger 6